MRKTKIVITLGPSLDDYERLKKAFEKANVARFNFSHGSHKEHLERLKMVRDAEGELGKIITAMADTKGPEVRTGDVEMEIEEGRIYSPEEFKLSPKGVVESIVEEGDMVLMDDGRLAFTVEKEGWRALNTYTLTPRRGVVVRGKDLPLPSMTEKDREDLAFIKDHFDVVAQSFVKTSEDVEEMKRLTGLPVVAKIESISALHRLDEIVEKADGIMVARGDLALAIEEEEVPYIQAKMVEKARRSNKAVIVATQMLESMTHNPFPTRAEVSDVYNAVLQGADALMLSGETAKGRFPLKAIEAMDKIIKRAEKVANLPPTEVKDYKARIALSAVRLSNDLDAPLIAPTMHGTTPRKLSSLRPERPIFVVSPKRETLRYLNLFYGVYGRERHYEPVFEHFWDIKADFKVGKAIFVFGYPPGNHMTNTIIYI